MCPTTGGDGESCERFPDLEPPPSQDATNGIPNAGLKGLDHYKRKLPPWRYNLRQRLLPLIRWETPYLAWMQNKLRTPALDTYFAISANLGTHTFFMTALPICFWCGWTDIGRGLVHVLMIGVFLTGVIKDMLSLPRPLSPPLHRINMSGYAALEYGFPSTHSANAVSVGVYFLLQLRSPEYALDPTTRLSAEIVAYAYMFSITLGRLYCGMHGFIDVLVGSVMGAGVALAEHLYGPAFENYLHSGTWHGPAVVAAVICVLVRLHPEPADDCPCFDDSVAVAGVIIGVELGGWHYASVNSSWDIPSTATVPFDLAHLGWLKVIVRVILGVVIIFLWREVMKPLLLKSLPHLFRFIEKHGYALPRTFFMSANSYNRVPARLRMDNLLPSVTDLPTLVTSIRHPGRGRSVSIGPQSAADAYETLAYRDKRRRESINSNSRVNSPAPSNDPGDGVPPSSNVGRSKSTVSAYEQMMGQGQVTFIPGYDSTIDEPTDNIKSERDLNESEIFSRIEKPRKRYDVEVVTKLVVYTGIAWLAVEGNPLVFEIIGLGMAGYTPRSV